MPTSVSAIKPDIPNMTDYQHSYANDRIEVPEFFNFGFDVVDKWAEDRTKLALLSADPSGEKATHHTFWDLKTLPTVSRAPCAISASGKATASSSCSHAYPSGTWPWWRCSSSAPCPCPPPPC